MVTTVMMGSNGAHTLRLRIKSCIQTITIDPSSHWLAELSNTCTRALHGISSRKSLGFFKAGSQGDSLFDFPLARSRSGTSLHTSASASPKVRDEVAARALQKEAVDLMARCTNITTTVQDKVGTTSQPSAKGAVLHQGNLSLTLTLRCQMSTQAVILTMR